MGFCLLGDGTNGMADSIVKATKEYTGKRLVVVTGATHRYILYDLLRDNRHVELKEFWEIERQNPVEKNTHKLRLKVPAVLFCKS